MEEIINNSNSTMNEHETSTNVLSIEVFLNERYLFRHNVLNGKTEFAKKLEDGTVTEYRVLTQKALNSILIQAKREDVFEEGGSHPAAQPGVHGGEGHRGTRRDLLPQAQRGREGEGTKLQGDVEGHPEQVHLAGNQPQNQGASGQCHEGVGLRKQRVSPLRPVLCHSSGSLKWGTCGECVGNLEKGSPPFYPFIHRHFERFVGNGEHKGLFQQQISVQSGSLHWISPVRTCASGGWCRTLVISLKHNHIGQLQEVVAAPDVEFALVNDIRDDIGLYNVNVRFGNTFL